MNQERIVKSMQEPDSIIEPEERFRIMVWKKPVVGFAWGGWHYMHDSNSNILEFDTSAGVAGAIMDIVQEGEIGLRNLKVVKEFKVIIMGVDLGE